MKIAIDLQACQTDSRDRGIGRYALSLAKEMVRLGGPGVKLMLDGSDSERLRDLRGRLRHDKVSASALTYHYPTSGTEFANDVDVVRGASMLRARTLGAMDVDAVLVSSVFEGFDGGAGITTALDDASLRGIAKVAIAYDMIPLIFAQRYLPEGSEYSDWYRGKLEEFRRFDLFLAISKATRDDLIELAGVDPDRIHVIGAGLDESFLTTAAADSAVDNEILRSLDIEGPFVLTVGNGDWRKNNEGALKAFLRLPNEVRRTHQLVFTQVGNEVTNGLVTEFASIASRVIVLGKVEECVLSALYRRCAVFFFPSRYEGFGLPVLEAMAFGAAVVSSNAGALQEVLRSEDASFNPEDADQAARILERALTDVAFRTRLIDGAAAHARSFTWERCASLAVDAIARLVSSRTARPPLTWQPSSADVGVLAGAVTVSDGGLASLRRGLTAIREGNRRRILVDVTCVVVTEARTGIQRVVRNYCIGLHAWAKNQPDTEIVPFCWRDDGLVHSAHAFARDSLGVDMPGDDGPVQVRPNDVAFMLDSTWEWPERFDPFLEQVWANGGEVVWMVYDLVPILVPETCHPGMPPVFRHWLNHAARCADGFVCISEATRTDLEAYIDEVLPHGARRPWSRTVHLGSDLESGRVLPTTVAAQVSIAAIGNRPAHLVLGTLEPRKDHATILEAFEKVWDEDVDVALVIVGKAGWSVDLLAERLRRHREAGKRLFWLERASDGDVNQLIQRTAALIQASIAEGFGLPIIEAGSQGVPLILSDIPVFREIAGDEASYFRSGDSEGLAQLIREGSSLGNWMRPSGIRTMTWRESSDQLAKVLLCS
ncbi:MAG: glycosyltransferase family 4 protein [Pseudomonas sp.]